MNEQDIINLIKNKSTDISVPENLSPENMEKMLDENIEQQSHSESNTILKKRRICIAFAACFCVFIISLGTIGRLHNGKTKSAVFSDHYTESVDVTSDDIKDYYNDDDYAIHDDNGSTDYTTKNTEGDTSIEKDLAMTDKLSSPANYDDYYDILMSAYKTYESEPKTAIDYMADDVLQTDEYYDADNDYLPSTESAVEDFADIAENDAVVNRQESATRSQSAKEKDGSNDNDHSFTNTQEKDIDEGDSIKTDGQYIYVAHYKKVETAYISITKTDKGSLSNISTIDLGIPGGYGIPGEYGTYFDEFYLYNDSLIVLYSRNISDIKSAKNLNTSDTKLITCVTIYDISDKKNPKQTKTVYQSGFYSNSRISGGYLYTISCFSPGSIIFDKYNNKNIDYGEYIPILNDDYISCTNMYYTNHLEDTCTYVITSLNPDDPDKYEDFVSISSSELEMYMGEDSIYLYCQQYDEITKTELLKISYNRGSLTMKNRALIAGYLYGSFALSEYNGYLRVVSTIPANNLTRFTSDQLNTARTNSNIAFDKDINALYILNSNMSLSGKLTGLAPGERIYSARFMGDIGYFVTYENTDPLFSVDLSDPYNPQIIGKLKIPGFSSYLHFYGENKLLGIGEETDPDTGQFLGIKLSMFDIHDPSNVTESDKLIIPQSCYSNALYDYKSIMIDPVKNIFGFCYERQNTDRDNLYYYDIQCIYATYTYDKKKGFIQTAEYAIDDEYVYEYDGIRGLYIGDYLYLVTPESITSYKLGSKDRIASVYFR